MCCSATVANAFEMLQFDIHERRCLFNVSAYIDVEIEFNPSLKCTYFVCFFDLKL